MIKALFNGAKLLITDKKYHGEWKTYMKKQHAVRKKMHELVSDFSPWSGYYMHQMIVTMLEFYEDVYSSGDCVWRDEASRKQIATSLQEALSYAQDLELLDALDDSRVLEIAKKDKIAFTNFVAQYEKTFGKVNEQLLPGVAYAYLEKKYTKHLYQIIGNYIWEWCD